MSKVKVVLFKEDDGTIPVIEFMNSVPQRQREKLVVRVERLREFGRELRRPEADYLRDDIYELRVRFGHVNYRLLYFFHGSTIAVLAAGLTKEDRVPPRDINLAVRRRARFIEDPARYGCDFHEGIAQ
jgi:phage-related protein